MLQNRPASPFVSVSIFAAKLLDFKFRSAIGKVEILNISL